MGEKLNKLIMVLQSRKYYEIYRHAVTDDQQLPLEESRDRILKGLLFVQEKKKKKKSYHNRPETAIFRKIS